MQETWVQVLVREDPTCGATKPVRQNYWSQRALEPTHHTTEARTPRARALQQEKPPQREACALQQRVAPACPSQLERSPHTATKTQHSQINKFFKMWLYKHV